MERFEQLCKMTQPEVKEYMDKFLADNDYAVANEDGFIYAEPRSERIPVLLVAHMDTVHKEQCKEIINDKGKLSSPQGIGGDDRCGIYIIMNIISELRCPVLLTEDEEIGGVGARKFTKTDYIHDLDVNYMIEFDRRGCNDAVYYSCDNKEFKTFVKETTGMKEAQGSYSDISTLMPASKIAGVNFSSGYYNAHTTSEYVIFDEMEDIIESAKDMIMSPCEEPFEYVAKTYNFGTNFSRNYEKDYQCSLFDDFYMRDNSLNDMKRLELELEVLWTDENNREKSELCYGNTKADCWFEFFMEHPDVCMRDVTYYSWN